jgi:mannose-6-phosphate isomerase-like protein (cupin superfamily)
MSTEPAVGFTHKRIDEMEAIWGGGFKRARAELGVTSFGISVSDLPPNIDFIPPHAHTFDNQEEIYIALAGSGAIGIEGELIPLTTDTAIRVGPSANRTQISGPEGLSLLSAGAILDGVYEPFPFQVLGAPEPGLDELPGVIAAKANESVSDYTFMPYDDMEPSVYADAGVTVYPVRRSLGISSFGVSRMDLEYQEGVEWNNGYPNHKHEDNGQEEVYVIAEGSGQMLIGEELIDIKPREMIRVAPDVSRKMIPSEEGLRFYAFGATPGVPYDAPERR